MSTALIGLAAFVVAAVALVAAIFATGYRDYWEDEADRWEDE